MIILAKTINSANINTEGYSYMASILKSPLALLCSIIFLQSAFAQEINLGQWPSFFTQKKNSTEWPYGGVEKVTNFFSVPKPKKTPLYFSNFANFNKAHFDSIAHFNDAHFGSIADFNSARFDSMADFNSTRFDSMADFDNAEFYGETRFHSTRFDRSAGFRTKFYGKTEFYDTKFYGKAIFRHARFFNNAYFGSAYFDSSAYFSYIKFFSNVYFQHADFKGDELSFVDSEFIAKVDFRNVQFLDTSIVADFSSAIIRDTIYIGNDHIFSTPPPKFNFLRTKFSTAGTINVKADTLTAFSNDTLIRPEINIKYPGAKIILSGVVDLKMQLEKLAFVKLSNTLDYYSKKDIISVLKSKSFKNIKAAQYELDYILAKSTAYQKVSTEYLTYSIFHPAAWWQFLYDITMGLGYRPFRLLYWVLFLIIGFAIAYIKLIPNEVNEFILLDGAKPKRKPGRPKKDKEEPLLSTIINCMFFSSMVFFTFRLKRDILSFFSINHKSLILSQWLIGFLIYIAFLTLSKSGSIFHTLKGLFIG